MGKSAPKAPETPDYVGAAREQGVANVEAARTSAKLNNPNIISPYGTQTVSWGQPYVDNAGYQAALDNYNAGSYDADGNWTQSGTAPTIDQFTYAGNSDTPTITQTLTPTAQKTLDSQQQVQLALANLGQQGIGTAQRVLGQPFEYNGPNIQTSLGRPGPVDYGPSAGQYGEAGSVNPNAYGQAGGVNAGPESQRQLDLSGVARAPINAGMTAQNAIMSRLQPQITQRNDALTQQLANQGITPGSEAYQRAMTQNAQDNNDLLTQAALQGVNLDMSANQQGYNQALGQAGLYNSALNDTFGRNLSAAQIGNQAVAQNYGMGSDAQAQRNAAIAQNFGQGSQSAGMYNAAQNQVYNQNLQGAQFGNQAAQQALAQQLQLYNQPLNQITALMSGSQIQTPQFQGYQGQNVQAAPIANAVAQQGQAAQQNYANQMAAYNSQMSGLGGLFGSALGLISPFKLFGS